MEKQCFKCREVKPITEFYKHSAMADGHLNKCKECTKRDVNQHREDNLEKVKEYDRNRPNAKERVEKHSRRIKRIMVEQPEKYQQYMDAKNKWARRNPHKTNSHLKLARAIKLGEIIKTQQCEKCGSTENIQGHHEDYSKPLEVIWLCPACHGNRHAEIRAERRNKNTPKGTMK